LIASFVTNYSSRTTPSDQAELEYRGASQESCARGPLDSSADFSQ
jgi:hypothetical protein